MYRYADRNGNVFVLAIESEARLIIEVAQASDMTAQARKSQDRALSSSEYMSLISAFSLAIDNRLCQCELRNASTSMILTSQDGQQRRYFLAAGSTERAELEGLLREYVGIEG